MKYVIIATVLLSTLSGCLLSPDKVFESRTATDTLRIESTDTIKSSQTIIKDSIVYKNSILRDTTRLKDTVIKKDTVIQSTSTILKDTVIKKDTSISIVDWSSYLIGSTPSGLSWVSSNHLSFAAMNPVYAGRPNLGMYVRVYLSVRYDLAVPFIIKIVKSSSQLCSCDVYRDTSMYVPSLSASSVSPSSILNKIESPSTADVAEGQKESVLLTKIQWKLNYITPTSFTLTDISGKYFIKPVTFSLTF